MPNLDLTPSPPITPKRPAETTQHGITRLDNYQWLKDENWQQVMTDPALLNADIRAHLEAENAYTKAVLSALEPLKNTIFEEMKGRLNPRETQVPAPDGPYAYYHRYRDGDQHGLYARAATTPDDRTAVGDEETILDAEALSKNHTGFFNIGDVAHSPDHKKIAYTIDTKGSENYEIFVGGVSEPFSTTGIKTSTGSVTWGQDSDTIYWTERDENQRPCKVFARSVSSGAEALKIYQESDPGYFVSVGESDSGDFIMVSAHNHTTSELHLMKSGGDPAALSCLAARKPGREYSSHEQGGYFYILTNDGGAVDFKIMRAPIDEPGQWEDYIPHRPGTLIIGMEAYKHFLVWIVRENALPKIVVRDMRSGEDHEIAFDEEAYALGLLGGYEYDTDWLRFAYSSPTTPRQIFDYNMDTRERVLRDTQVIPSGHDPEKYVTERFSLPARDGEMVPVTILRRKETPIDGSAPLLLYGYGSYGITIPAGFRTSILSLVDRGFIYAIAHIRGGMAKGYQWYLDGKLETKTRTFDDFVDAARGLIDEGYTSKGRIVAHGGSAGGMLVGAALNQDPALWGGIIAAVPFVDVLNTMSDDTLPLTPPEWPEWGNPIEDKEAYDRIAAYSPYDNVADAEFPPLFITAGLTDPRVTYWEPAKWAARLRDHQKGDAPILFKVNMDAGHQGEAGRYDSLKEIALEYAFAVSIMDAD